MSDEGLPFMFMAIAFLMAMSSSMVNRGCERYVEKEALSYRMISLYEPGRLDYQGLLFQATQPSRYRCQELLVSNVRRENGNVVSYSILWRGRNWIEESYDVDLWEFPAGSIKSLRWSGEQVMVYPEGSAEARIVEQY